MSNSFNWTLPTDGSIPICFTSITHSIRNYSSYSAMESWSVEEINPNYLAINFRTTSSEAGNKLLFYSGNLNVASLILENNIQPYIFYTIKVKYPESNKSTFAKYRNIILKSQTNPSYPVFSYNSHTHLDLWSPTYNKYVANVSESNVNETGGIGVVPGNLINMSILNPSNIDYIEPKIDDIYDFRELKES